MPFSPCARGREYSVQAFGSYAYRILDVKKLESSGTTSGVRPGILFRPSAIWRKKSGGSKAPSLRTVVKGSPRERGMAGLSLGSSRFEEVNDHLGNLEKMPVQGEQSEAVLGSRGCDPHVVGRDGSALPPKIVVDGRIADSRLIIHI